MKCDRCSQSVSGDESYEHLGQVLCEDCYMDALSPVRTCDPWAAHCAKSFEQHSNDPAVLTPLQKDILRVLKESGGMDREGLFRRFEGRLTRSSLEREFATLKHMERVGAQKTDTGVLLKAL